MMRREVALGLGFFALYVGFAAPGVEWLDAGELTLAGFTLGVSHPPGQPGYSLLVRAAALLPFGEVAFRANLLSAATTAAALVGACALVRAVFVSASPLPHLVSLIPAVVVGASPLVVEQATRAEVYGPALALCTWGATSALGYTRTGEARHAGIAAFLFALAATVHPLIAAVTALPFAAAILARPPYRRLLTVAPFALGLGLLGLLVYAYLPLRALAPDRALFVWGEPKDLPSLFDVVLARAYAGHFAAEGMAARLAGHVLLLGEGPGLCLLFLGTAGLVFGAVTRLRGALPMLCAILTLAAAAAAQGVFHPENPDVHGYLSPALPLLGAGLAVLLVFAHRLIAKSALPRATWIILALPLVGLALLGPYVHAEDRAARRTDDPLRYVDRTVLRLPPGPAIYVANSDHALFPALYERLVGGARPDVALVNQYLCTSSWFLAFVERALPDVFVPYLEDGGRRDALYARLVTGNLGAGHGVYGEEAPSPNAPYSASARGLSYRFHLGASSEEDLPFPHGLSYAGPLGRRIARHAGLLRARYELGRGRWLEAAQAAGVLERFDELARTKIARIPAGTRPLFEHLPALTPVFVFADWQAELVADDIAFFAGLEVPEPPADAPPERGLLVLWQRLLQSDPRAEARLASLPPEAGLGAAHMLLAHGQPEKAVATVRAVLVAHPRHLMAHIQLGQLLAELGQPQAAAQAWRAALAIDPTRHELRAWLERLSPSAP
jgi:hypothetical protein